jgi:membrane protease YdiL (CAAX protease family)
LIAHSTNVERDQDVASRFAARDAAAVSVVIAAVSVAGALVAAAALSSLGLTASSWLDPRGALRQALVAAVSLVPVLVALRSSRSGLDSVGLTRVNLGRSVAVGIALAAAWLLVSGSLDELMSPRPEHASVLGAAAAVGFSEEIVWRGYVQSWLIRWIGTRRGVVLAATVFALFHIPQRLLVGVGGADLVVQLLVVWILGAVLGVLQAATRNVVLPGILHTAIDWSARFSAMGR